jgi:hypothetical protein
MRYSKRDRQGCGCGCGTLFLAVLLLGFIVPKSPVDSTSRVFTEAPRHKELAPLPSPVTQASPERTFTPESARTPFQSKWTLPNAALTPGDIFYVTVEQLAHSGYTRTVRNVSNATKHQVYLAYGITDTHGYVIDHLIPLEIGGSNEVTNLWPQPKKESRIKDKLEETLHHLIISHRVDLATAQQEVAANWVAAYDKYCGAAKEPEFTDIVPTIPKLASTPEARPKSVPQAKTHGPLVWVNTNTGVYHYPGTRWYGNTVAGRYISEEDAIGEGDRPAKNGQ